MNNNENINETQRYADDIAAHLSAWQLAAEYVEAVAGGYADDDETGEPMDIFKWSNIKPGDDDVTDEAANLIVNGELDGVETIADAWHVYLENVLSVEVTGKNIGYGWEVTGAEVTVTSGGPSCWIEWNGGTGLTVCASWGSDRGSVRVNCDDLCEALVAFTEAFTQ